MSSTGDQSPGVTVLREAVALDDVCATTARPEAVLPSTADSRVQCRSVRVAESRDSPSVVLLARNDSSNPTARIIDVAAPTRNQVDMRVEHRLPRVGPDIDSQVESPHIRVTR